MGRISFKTSVEAIFEFAWNLLRVVLLSAVLNPVVWWLWALIAPKSAVKLLNYIARHNKKTLRYSGRVWFFFDRLVIKILPWRSKRYFYQKFNPDYMSDKQKARAYREGWLDKQKLTDAAKDIVWNYSMLHWRDLATGKLSLEQFANVLYSNEEETLRIHLEAQTPSKDKMEYLLGHVAKNQSTSTVAIMKKAVSKYGLHPELIKQVFEQALYVQIKDTVMSAIDEYQEVEIVKSLENKQYEWQMYLRSHVGAELKLSAQRVLTQQQFKTYVLQNKRFNVDLLWEWMNDTVKREWVVDHVKSLLKSGSASEAIKALVKADKWWREKLFEI